MPVGCDLAKLPFCCGFYTVGDFREGEESVKYVDYNAESPEELTKKLMNICEGRPIIFNFLREAQWDEFDDLTGDFNEFYECEVLMKYIETHEKSIDIGTWINPGTGNEIHGFILKDYK